MQWLVDLINTPNGTFIVCFAGFAMVLGMLFAKKGLLSVHTNAVSIGAADREHDIIRRQQRWARTFLYGLEPFIKELGREDYSDDLTWRCLDRAYIAVIEWITFNHISADEYYVKEKQSELTSLMYSLGIKEQYRTQEFKERMEAWIKDLVQGLYNIRKNYK